MLGKAGKSKGELGTAGQKVGESFGKLKKSMADHTFVHSCAFRSPARSGLMPLGGPCGAGKARENWGQLGKKLGKASAS